MLWLLSFFTHIEWAELGGVSSSVGFAGCSWAHALHTVSADVTGSIEMWELVPGIEGKPLPVGVCMQGIRLCFNVAAPISESVVPAVRLADPPASDCSNDGQVSFHADLQRRCLRRHL